MYSTIVVTHQDYSNQRRTRCSCKLLAVCRSIYSDPLGAARYLCSNIRSYVYQRRLCEAYAAGVDSGRDAFIEQGWQQVQVEEVRRVQERGGQNDLSFGSPFFSLAFVIFT